MLSPQRVECCSRNAKVSQVVVLVIYIAEMSKLFTSIICSATFLRRSIGELEIYLGCNWLSEPAGSLLVAPSWASVAVVLAVLGGIVSSTTFVAPVTLLASLSSADFSRKSTLDGGAMVRSAVLALKRVLA